MSRRHTRMLTGLALVGTVIAVGAAVKRSQPQGQDLTVVLTSANGLIGGAEVRAGGLPIGSITSVELDDDGYPHLTLRLDRDYVVRRGATATVRMPSQAGQLNRFVDIENGDGPVLRDGSVIGLGATEAPVEFDDLLSVLTPDVRAQVRGIIARSDQALRGRSGDLAETIRTSGTALDQVANLAAEVNRDRASLRALVQTSAAGVDALASQRTALGRSVESTAVLLEVTQRRQREIDELLRTAPEALEGLRPVLRRVPRELPRLSRTLKTVDGQTRELSATSAELQRTSATLPATLQAAQRMLTAAQTYAPAVGKLFAAAAPIVKPAAEATRMAAPIVDYSRVMTPEAWGWMVLIGNAVKSYDAAGHGLNVFGTAVDVPRRLVSSSDCTAGLVPRPFARVPGQNACDPWDDYAKTFLSGTPDPLSLPTPAQRASRDLDIP
ncbi:MAG: MCE family protein [Solirubrobacteraceae bacterium]|nr:MCE family protein [Solirubrobacteraceae bacterium]